LTKSNITSGFISIFLISETLFGTHVNVIGNFSKLIKKVGKCFRFTLSVTTGPTDDVLLEISFTPSRLNEMRSLFGFELPSTVGS
jgi:hypothetical protein